jgi:hypothetical protein
MDVGSNWIPGGRIANAGLGMFSMLLYIPIFMLVKFVYMHLHNCTDMLATGAQLAAYAYDKDQAPEDAFKWWLSSCGGSDLVPEDFKKVFDYL